MAKKAKRGPGRPTLNPAEKRSDKTLVNFNREEWNLIVEAADSEGKKVATYIRERAIAAAKRRVKAESSPASHSIDGAASP